MYKDIFVILGFVLIVVVASSPSVTSAIPNRSNDTNTTCAPTGNSTANGGEEVECCWVEPVPPGTGGIGNNNYEFYCSACENGGTRGNINCSDPELQYRDGGKPLPPISGTINNGQISDDRKPLPPISGTINNGQISDDPVSSNNNDSPNPGIGPKGGLAGGIGNLQSNNNIIQGTPDSGEDESPTSTSNTQDQIENSSEGSPNN